MKGEVSEMPLNGRSTNYNNKKQCEKLDMIRGNLCLWQLQITTIIK